MKFGIFDHVDDSGLPLTEHLEARLRMAEVYDECGFHCYHMAEHHGTPLGHAPSPGIMFAALSQRTTRLRFGPLVYILPLYHPLRLIEEIGMLDALSRGRFDFGFGRGISPVEMGFYGVNMAEQAERAAEAREVVMKGLTSDVLTHHGKHFTFDDVPMLQRPVQRPHPPLWYGTNVPGSVARCAQERLNMVTLATGEAKSAMPAVYREAYAASGGAPGDIPLIGVARHIVVADTDEEAKALARPAFARWRAHFVLLWEQGGADNPFVRAFPKDWEAVEASGAACAGSPATVRDFVAREAEADGFTYFLGQFAFGDLTADQVSRSARLFAAEVMPAFAD